MEKYSSHLVSYAVAGDASAPRATVAGEPGAAWEDVERAGALHSTGTPCPVQGRANSPYQQLVAGNAAAVADLAVPSVAEVVSVLRFPLCSLYASILYFRYVLLYFN